MIKMSWKTISLCRRLMIWLGSSLSRMGGTLMIVMMLVVHGSKQTGNGPLLRAVEEVTTARITREVPIALRKNKREC